MKPGAKSVLKIGTYHRMASSNTGTGPEEYDGLPVLALPGLHDFVVGRMKEVLAPGSEVLDLGAGTGAMAKRLKDMGFVVTAMDVVEDNFRLNGNIPFVQADLNNDFGASLGRRFDGIVAVEIVEHLENPRKFLRECHGLLIEGGYLFLTLPNIDNPLSKAMFLRGGTFQWFTDYNYEKDGHISPITHWLLGKMIEEAGLTMDWLGSFGDPLKGLRSFPWRMAARFIRLISRTPRRAEGEITVVVIRK